MSKLYIEYIRKSTYNLRNLRNYHKTPNYLVKLYDGLSETVQDELIDSMYHIHLKKNIEIIYPHVEIDLKNKENKSNIHMLTSDEKEKCGLNPNLKK